MIDYQTLYIWQVKIFDHRRGSINGLVHTRSLDFMAKSSKNCAAKQVQPGIEGLHQNRIEARLWRTSAK